MSKMKTAAQHNLEYFGTYNTPEKVISIRSLSPQECHECKDTEWPFEYHIWVQGAKKGDKCKCGKVLK